MLPTPPHTPSIPTANVLRQPRPASDSYGPDAIGRLEESAARLSISSRPDPDSGHFAPRRRSSARANASTRPSNVTDAPQSATTVASPIDSSRSSRSFSWSQASARLGRADSRITQARPEQQDRTLDSALNRSNTARSKSGTIHSHRTPFPRLDPAHLDTFDSTTAALAVPDSATADAVAMHTAPTRSASTASKASTILTTRSLFRDFDGTHYLNLAGEIAEEDEGEEDEGSSLLKPDDDGDEDGNDDHDENSDKGEHNPPAASDDDPGPMSFITFDTGLPHDQQQQADGGEEMLGYQAEDQPANAKPRPWAVPPPNEDMVYYPAPVPMNLNLPKRLSRQSPAVLQAQRRSQMLGAMASEARRSAVWPSATESNLEASEPASRDTKRKTVNMQKLPPQLRASIFFDQQPVQHDIEIHRGSAVLSLERMLDASANTPVGVPATMPTTRPTARTRNSRSTLMSNERLDTQRSRSSLMPERLYSDEDLGAGDNPRFARNSSTLAILEEGGRASGGQLEDSSKSPEADYVHVNDDFDTDDHLNYEEDAFAPDKGFHHEQQAAAPNTLLAELQLRKAELKSRTRTAAPVYHTGMQSTLLELDAVAQIEKQRRVGKHTHLAWEGTEDPALRAHQDDDDVPLGLLYPAKNALVNMAGAQQVGLVEKRAMDDNEPLSRRRNRLLGIETPPPQPLHDRNESRASVPVIGVYPTEPVEEETLAQRTRRLRSSRILDEAIGLNSGQHSRAVSDDFASEMMSQLGVGASPNASSGAKTPDVEETLGQRRNRLQAERQASGGGSGNFTTQHQRPDLRSAHSLSNVLASAPARTNNGSSTRLDQSGMSGGSQFELAARRQQLADRDMRSATYAGFGGPLPYVGSSRGSQSAFHGVGSYNNSTAGMAGGSSARDPGPQQSLGRRSSAMSLGMMSGSGGMQSPSLHLQHQWPASSGRGYSNGIPMMSPFMQPGFAPNSQAQYWQQQMYPTMTPALNINTNMVAASRTDDFEAGMSPEQRTNIDRWRQSVMP